MHSSFSSDSKEPMENMIRRAMELGLKEICFTEHHDTDFAHVPGRFQVDIEAYRDHLLKMRQKFPEITIRFGVESGYMPHTIEKTDNIMRGYDFDFIIGSVHSIDGEDLFYKNYTSKDRQVVYGLYLEEIYKIMQKASHFNVLGHINYPSKIDMFKEKPMIYQCFEDTCDAIFKTLIEKGKGMEFNTSTMRHSRETNSVCSFIKRYKELGGEIITIGADAHSIEGIHFMYSDALSAIKECGFEYIATFENMQPVFHKI
jgi:histidinol-phosphatase (PHP family)